MASRFTGLLLIAVLMMPQVGQAQFDGDFSFDFDSSIFEDDSLFDAAGGGPRHFTFKLSQQTYGHANRHSVVGQAGDRRQVERESEINRSALLLKYQNPFASGWLLQGSAQAKVYWAGDYEHEANGGRIDTDLRVNELFVQRSSETQSISFGRQTLVWGETVGNSVLDVINTSEFRDLTVIDIEDARLNQWLLIWDWFPARGGSASGNSGNSGSWSSFINLYPDFNPAPVRGSPFFHEPPFNLSDYRRDKPLFEAGTRWSRSFTGSDVALMGAWLYENQLRYGAPLYEDGDAVAHSNGFWLLGASANRAIGKLLLKFDLAYSHGLIADTLLLPAMAGGKSASSSVSHLSSTALPIPSFERRGNQLGTSFGFEYAISNEQSISLGILAQRFLDSDASAVNERLLNEGTTGNVLLRYSNSLKNDNLLLSATLQSDLAGDSTLLSLAANYSLNDNWAVTTQLIATQASRGSALAFLDEDLRVGASLSWSF